MHTDAVILWLSELGMMGNILTSTSGRLDLGGIGSGFGSPFGSHKITQVPHCVRVGWVQTT